MTEVILGSNDFYGVPFPLVLADQFFHIYTGTDGRMQLDIFRWDQATTAAIYEVEGNVPRDGKIITNPTGVVTFSAEEGGFLFKFRPKPGISQIFGQIPGPNDLTAYISDREIRVDRDGQTIATLRQNQFSDDLIGILVGADGSVAIGVSGLPDGMVLIRQD